MSSTASGEALGIKSRSDVGCGAETERPAERHAGKESEVRHETPEKEKEREKERVRERETERGRMREREMRRERDFTWNSGNW